MGNEKDVKKPTDLGNTDYIYPGEEIGGQPNKTDYVYPGEGDGGQPNKTDFVYPGEGDGGQQNETDYVYPGEELHDKHKDYKEEA